MILVKSSLPHQRGGHRDLEALSQDLEAVMGTCADRTTPHIKEGTTRLTNQGKRIGNRINLRMSRLPEPRRMDRSWLNWDVIKFFLTYIFGDIDQYRARTS